MDVKKGLEAGIIVLVLSAFLYLGLGNAWEFKVKHDHPYGYLASDSFLHQSVADYFKETGQVKITPWYEVGGHRGVYDVHPPFLYYMSAVFSKAAGIEVYDGIYFITVLFFALTALVLYFVLRRFNTHAALIGIPFTLLILTVPFNQGIWWGNWLFVAGVLFLFLNVWFLQRISERGLWRLFGVSLAATFLAHPPQAIFTVFFIILFLLFEFFVFRKDFFVALKPVIFAGIASFALAAYNLGIFYRGFYLLQGGLQTVREGTFGFREVNLGLLGFWGLLAIGGFFVYIIWFLAKRDRASWVIALFSLFMFAMSYMYVIGFGKRAYTHRFYWWFYLAFFIGFGIHFVVKNFIYKKWDFRHSAAVALGLLLLFGVPLLKVTNAGSGLMDGYTWESLLWIRENTDPDSFVYYFYSDGLSQAAALYNSHRVSFKINPKTMDEGIQQQKIFRKYFFGLADSYHVYLCEFNLLSDAGYYPNHLNLQLVGNSTYGCTKMKYQGLVYPPKEVEEKDICTARYLYFTKSAGQQVLAQYNMAIAQTLLQKPWIKEIYSNPLVAILENENPGDDCLG
ncbi:MAG TPA: hypothetical protein VJB08_04420 [Candidatus Nanoarchaeia archaeon]|nr:hypothetical protein [Candidatus Nanoarchaeia archaeon]